MNRLKAEHLRSLIEKLVVSLSDEEALSGVELFPKWVIEHSYLKDDRVKHNNILYKCVQPHTSYANWAPDLTPALWTPVSIDEFPEWVQPTGSQDAYKIGDKVSYIGKHWISIVNDNVWKPDVYGWDEV